MILPINNTETISDLQDAFSQCFPGLKIEFFKKPCTYNQKCLLENRVERHVPLYTLRKSSESGILEVMSWYTTARLVKEFRIRFGMYVQVFRKENRTWKQIDDSDTFTLREQMERAQLAALLSVPRLKKQHREYEYL